MIGKREIELLDNEWVGERYVGFTVGKTWRRFRNELSIECLDSSGASWIPRCFCLGTGGEESPISLGIDGGRQRTIGHRVRHWDQEARVRGLVRLRGSLSGVESDPVEVSASYERWPCRRGV